ncbi:MAG TPA: hypothetical protein VMA75_00510 [Candidatus Paceibacterota bacterium]|nr:hypothetical protein [Candidatus Paceibacterota bacterium]
MEQKPKGKLLDWLNHHPVITIVMIMFVIGIVGVTAEAIAGQGSSTTSNSDLQATVETTNDGISITNLESDSWQSCEVGVNGGCGFNFDNPPYQSHISFDLAGGASTTIPYSTLTSADGTRFDITTHAVNSIVIMCSMGANDRTERSFCGMQ